jgi:hypothetical protein
MSPKMRLCLNALAELSGTFCDCDYTYAGFQPIMARTGLCRAEVRRSVRALARRGLAEFGKGLWTEDGYPAGSGYRPTAAGRAIAEPPADG